MRYLSVFFLLPAFVILGACSHDEVGPTSADLQTTHSADVSQSLTQLDPRFASTGFVVFTDRDLFESYLGSGVQVVSQDTSLAGNDIGGGTYQLDRGAVSIQMQGPAFYGNIGGVDVLGKGVPVDVSFLSRAEGVGMVVAQFSKVEVTVTDEDAFRRTIHSFSNGGLGFLGFLAQAGIGISNVTFSDPNPHDSATPITNIGDITFGRSVKAMPSFPFACDIMASRTPTVQVEVQGSQVNVTATAHGVGIPGEVTRVFSTVEGSFGRFAFWPNGRHTPPKITSDLFPTRNGSDFPVSASIHYTHSDITGATNVLANLDYEILSAAYDDSGRLRLGGRDEQDRFVPGQFVILQCDRGLEYTVNP